MAASLTRRCFLPAYVTSNICRKGWLDVSNRSRIVLCLAQPTLTLIRSSTNKHWDPKFKKLRRQKVLKVDLPDFNEQKKNLNFTPEELRTKMKEKGIVPPRAWSERPIVISCTGGIFEGYVPPEGDGKMSTLSVAGTKQKLQWLEKKGRSLLALRKVRDFEDDFDVHEFSAKAQEIYIDVHKYLAEKDEDKLHELVTERCFPEMMLNVERKTMRWNFIESLSIPRVVHVRCTDVVTKTNVFAQMTVRFHSRQTLAIYDRFGRLMHGSENVARDVLEYVVFEKHLANLYGVWRVHGKIIPDWAPPKEPLARTYRKPQMAKPPPAPAPPSESDTEDEKTVTTKQQQLSPPQTVPV